MKVKNLFLIAAGVFMLTTTFTATAKKLPKEVKMTKEVLMDKIKGGWPARPSAAPTADRRSSSTPAS